MDPMDYVPHNHHHPRSAAHYDPVHSASAPWVPQHHHSQSTPVYPWHPHAPSMPHSFPHHPLQPAHAPSSEPFHLAPNGGLPPPVPGFHGSPPSDGFPGPMLPRHFHPSPHRSSGSLGGMPGGHIGAANDGAFFNQVPGGRPQSFQAPISLGMPPAGTSPEANLLPRPPFPLSDLPAANNFPQHNNANTHFAISQPPPPLGSFNTTPPRRTHFSSISPTARALREAQSPPRAAQSSSSSRRSHHRARRSMSSRFLDFEPIIPDEDEANRHLFVEHILGNARSDNPAEQQAIDDAILRQVQLVRGVSTKPVASKMALRSLQSVRVEDLPEAERTCVICYNDYGVETPEGINEAPLRLPKCKHVFGDHCIKKWFEDSDSCPYCRDKLHSEPKQHGQTARAFMSMMRMRDIHSGLAMHADEVLIRAMASTADPDPISTARHLSNAGRRSPPDDAGEQQRRTRPRHNNSNSQESSPPSRPASFERPSSSRPEANAPPPLFPDSDQSPRFSPTRMAASAQQRRSWAPGPRAGPPTSSTPETSRPHGLAQPSTPMSPSAPSFYPRRAPELVQRASEVFNVPGRHAVPSLSSRLPNPLHPPTNVTQSGQQQEAVNGLGSRPSVASEEPGVSGQVSPSQNMRNRPW